MKYTGNNSPDYWDNSWRNNVKKFPRYTMNRVFGLIPENVSVLDIGSGDGTFLKRLQIKKNCRVYGIDISFIGIEKGKNIGVPGEVRSAEEMDEVLQGLLDIVT